MSLQFSVKDTVVKVAHEKIVCDDCGESTVECKVGCTEATLVADWITVTKQGTSVAKHFCPVCAAKKGL